MKKLSLLIIIITAIGLIAAVRYSPIQVIDVRAYGAKGDGITDDTSAIQSAIQSGNKIYFPPLNFKVTSSLVLTNHLSISGAGYGLTTITASTGNNIFTGTDIGDIEISGIHFVGANQSYGSGDGMAVLFQLSAAANQSNIHIHDNSFTNFKGAGVVSIYGNNTSSTPTGYYSNVIIENNSFTGNTDRDQTKQGIASSSIYLTGGVKNFQVKGNFIDADTQKVGIEMIYNVNTGSVTDNIIRNNGIGNAGVVNAYGILSYVSPTTDNFDISITGNHLYNTSNMGMYLLGVRNHTVTGNTLENCDINSTDASLPAGAIAADINNTINNNIVITGNSIKDSVKNGIQVYNPVSSNKVTISGNSITNTSTGMLYGIRSRGNPSAPYNFAITGNYVYSTVSSGIYVEGSPTNMAVTGNIVGTSGYGIYISTSGTNIALSGNVINHSVSHGIFTAGLTDGSITGNVLTNNGGWGLFVNGTNTRLKVIGNSLNNNTSGNYFNNDYSTTTQYGNEGQSDMTMQQLKSQVTFGTTPGISLTSSLKFGTTSYATLTTIAGPANSAVLCSDCNLGTPFGNTACTSGGSGAIAYNRGGLGTGWKC